MNLGGRGKKEKNFIFKKKNLRDLKGWTTLGDEEAPDFLLTYFGKDIKIDSFISVNFWTFSAGILN